MHNALNNNREWDRTLITPQIEFNPQDITLLKQVYQEAFNEPNSFTEAKDVALQFKRRAEQEEHEIRQILIQKDKYPFLGNLEPLADLLRTLSKMEYGKLITDMRQYEDKLLDLKEDFYDPILQFWNGEQKKIYDQIREFKNNNIANLKYVESPAIEVLKETLEHNTPYKNNVMKDAKEALDALSERVEQIIKSEQLALIKTATQRMEEIIKSYEFDKVSENIQNLALKPFKEIINNADQLKFIGNIRDSVAQLSDTYTKQLNFLAENLPQLPDDEVSEPIIRYTSIKAIEKQLKVSKPQLESMSDVDDYLRKLRQLLEEKIKDNYKITLN